MRNCKKNQRDMYYSLYDSQIPVVDQDGFDEFEYKVGYSKPKKIKASLSTGRSSVEESDFGASVKYDRVICTFDTALDIDENALIWVKSKPEYNDDGTINEKSADFKVSASPLDGLNSLRIPVTRIIKSKDKNIVEDKVAFIEDGTDDGF